MPEPWLESSATFLVTSEVFAGGASVELSPHFEHSFLCIWRRDTISVFLLSFCHTGTPLCSLCQPKFVKSCKWNKYGLWASATWRPHLGEKAILPFVRPVHCLSTLTCLVPPPFRAHTFLKSFSFSSISSSSIQFLASLSNFAFLFTFDFS